MVYIPLAGLELFINVQFLIISRDLPVLLIMTDIITNGLDLSLQEKNSSIRDEKQSLSMQKHYL